MSVTLNPVLQALGYRQEDQQRDFVKLLAAAGVFGALPGVEGTLTDKQAQAVLAGVTFDNAGEAAHWLHDATQAHMLRRPPGVERWQCEEPESFHRNRGELLNALHHLHILEEIRPKAKHYDHVLVLGSVEGAVSTRLDTLKELYEQGVRFDHIHLLGSERPLDPEHEPLASVATDVGSVATEMQMMQARAYEKSEHWPEGLQNIKLEPVTTPDQAHGRANTRDTVESWLKTNPKPGSVLVISSQPNVAYQDAAVKSAMPEGFTVETVGARVAEDDLKISVAMDAIARQIDVGGFPKLLEALKTQATTPPPQLVLLNPKEIRVDALTYQYRSGGDANGVTKKRRGDTDKWDWSRDGAPLTVHRCIEPDASGHPHDVYYLVNGHHRRDKAVALNARGTGPGKVSAIVLGPEYSKLDARIVGVCQNMAEGRNDAADIADAARAFKAPFDVKKLSPYLKMEGDIKLSYSLRNLSDASLGMVAKGEVPAAMAAKVVEQVAEPARQDNVMRIISAKLHQNYDNYIAQNIISSSEKVPDDSWATYVGKKPAPTLAANSNGFPDFLARLKQPRQGATATAAAGVGLG